MKRFYLILVTILIAACSAKPNAILNPIPYSGTGPIDAYIVSHGWHTGIVIPAQAIQQRLPELGHRFGPTPYLEFGWGDKGFYQAKEITVGLTLRAIFWPTPSVMHVVAVPNSVSAYFQGSESEKVPLTDVELEALLNFIEHSFNKNDQGEIISLRKGIYGNSQFYQGVGDYYLMNTCNKWTAKGLKSIGMDISSTFKLTASSVIDFIREQKADQADQ